MNQKPEAGKMESNDMPDNVRGGASQTDVKKGFTALKMLPYHSFR